MGNPVPIRIKTLKVHLPIIEELIINLELNISLSEVNQFSSSIFITLEAKDINYGYFKFLDKLQRNGIAYDSTRSQKDPVNYREYYLRFTKSGDVIHDLSIPWVNQEEYGKLYRVKQLLISKEE